MALRSGPMIRVILERPSAARDSTYNEPVATWTTVVTTYATKRGLTGSERFSDNDVRSHAADTEWTFRWRSPFDPRWRIREQRSGDIHDIESVYDPTGRRERLTVLSTTFRPDATSELVP